MTDRVAAVGYLVTFVGDNPIRVEKAMGNAPGGLPTLRTRIIWESGRNMGPKAAMAVSAARRVRALA
jgi:hypothetical protein